MKRGGGGEGGDKQAVCVSDTCHRVLSLDNIGTDTQIHTMRKVIYSTMRMILTAAGQSSYLSDNGGT